MIDIKSIIETIISDFANDVSIAQIMLKSQIVLSQINDEKFIEYFRKEQFGYGVKDELPSYRIIPATIDAKVFVPFQGERVISIPVECEEDPTVSKLLTKILVVQSLSEIEDICAHDKTGLLHTQLPAFAYPELQKFLTHGSIQEAWQNTNTSRYKHIVDVFKSNLLSFFLKLHDEIDWSADFKSEENQTKITNITYNITAAIANTGSGSVMAGDVENKG